MHLQGQPFSEFFSFQIQQSSDSTEFCEICLSPFPRSLMTGLECGHRFCGDCWTEYLSVKVMSEGECFSISCPAHKCKILVDDASAMALIKDSKVRSKYQCLITQSFVECNRLLKWCPAPDCNRAVKVQYVNFKPVKCTCGRRFCYKCSKTWHAPILCEYMRKWAKTVAEDLSISLWIRINTKNCPKCYVAIEKNGGCNHMTCRICQHHFCWICSVNWFDHGYNTRCNRYVEAEEVNQEPDTPMPNLNTFHRTRFIYHFNFLEQERNLMMDVQNKCQRLPMSWTEVFTLQAVMTKAVNVLRQTRETLMYSYVFAYFVEKSNQKTIFEFNLQGIENTTDSLSHYLKMHIVNAEVDVIIRKVQNRTQYCDQFCRVLLDHVNEGYDKGWWTHLETA
ncbi:Similar to ARIH1: E3 ubiquitin-protein ligase ARIH1 (Homo sapiens) [Cotesia congregata]|uniref:RBR-type E3 ubiquitin transferase n=1 Tax=Cotesia congregata TaxID=51543 RepID=A0A8J2EHQ1_COTCN|nr:Similar to ARIH1: E3 ubiquitin-protein ligase ARIH1 (Homo sapiens) [Cotesia congregata]